MNKRQRKKYSYAFLPPQETAELRRLERKAVKKAMKRWEAQHPGQRRRKRIVRKTGNPRQRSLSADKLIPAKVRVSKDGTVRVFVNPKYLPQLGDRQ